ncbi:MULTISPECIES: phosphopantetheine-binding protein [unclassified Streptomyces]|uniref:phosphopantetheine-binding protein n=1 Tax=unclassified Streptomyces TaxID=2593676 RepID=UPI003827AED6
MTNAIDRTTALEAIRVALADRPHLAHLGELSPEVGLGEAGMDSLDLIIVFSHFEEKWEIEFDNEEVDPLGFDSLADLADALAARVSGAGSTA